MSGVDANGGKAVLAGLVAQLGNLVVGGFGLEQGVVNEGGQVGLLGNGPQPGREPVSAGLDDELDLVAAVADAKAGTAGLSAGVTIAGGAALILGEGEENLFGNQFNKAFNGLMIGRHDVAPIMPRFSENAARWR
jgi:hypothetical protein